MIWEKPTINLEHPVFGTICVCSGKKLKYQSFCRDCTLSLPLYLLVELWRPFANGYEKHWEKAKEQLDVYNQGLITDGAGPE